MTARKVPNPEATARRQKRYGKPKVRGWSWKTFPELLDKADTVRKELGLDKTEFIELAFQTVVDLHEAAPKSAPRTPDRIESGEKN